MSTKRTIITLASVAILASGTAFAGSKHKSHRHCPVTWQALNNALSDVVQSATSNGGFELNMWATVVNSEGKVCAVTKTGTGINDQWLGSRVISAQKANTANAFSLDNGLALSTANLWAASQPGGSLFGLQFSNPVETKWAYHGNAKRFGTFRDPMNGRRVGGVNVFGGGLALYDEDGNLVGAVGVSGDSSCADHNIAWRVRDGLGLDYVPAGLGADGAGFTTTTADNIEYDVTVDPATGLGVSASAWGHVDCGHTEAAQNAIIIGACVVGEGTTPACTALN